MGTTREIFEDRIEETQEHYEDILEQFLDDVFDVESLCSVAEWKAAVIKNCGYCLNSDEIREKFGYYKEICGLSY